MKRAEQVLIPKKCRNFIMAFFYDITCFYEDLSIAFKSIFQI